jgi:hypothetical protein
MICKALAKFGNLKSNLKMANFTREDLAFNGYSQTTTNAAEYFNTNDSSERTYIDKTEELK